MIYLGDEENIIVEKKRKIEYIRCDMCNKKILLKEFYMKLCHRDQDGNHTLDNYNDLCKDCALKYIDEHLDFPDYGEELSLEKSFFSGDAYLNTELHKYDNACKLACEDY